MLVCLLPAALQIRVPRTSYPFTQALITGASSGIGEQMAHMLGKAGVPMVLVARRGDRLHTLAQKYSDVEVDRKSTRLNSSH